MSADETKTADTATRVIRRDGAELLRYRAMHLTVAGSPTRASLTVSPMRIGSAPDNDLVLTADGVSGHHCEVVLSDAGPRIRDLHSTNGTLVNGVRVDSAYVGAGARLLLGAAELTLIVEDADVEAPLSTRTNFGGLLGHSPRMRAVFATLESVAKADATLLITGESGTGKELAARGVHDASARRNGPYIVFDCGAVAASLIESTLFGHERGAFTGAVDAREGVFEQADGGTLVLDEIGELPLELQPKLLRAIETKTVTRLGGKQQTRVNTRLVASTNKNLASEAAAGRFRQDLYFRLSVIRVTLPPLRERREEIPRLVAHLLNVVAPNGVWQSGLAGAAWERSFELTTRVHVVSLR